MHEQQEKEQFFLAFSSHLVQDSVVPHPGGAEEPAPSPMFPREDAAAELLEAPHREMGSWQVLPDAACRHPWLSEGAPGPPVISAVRPQALGPTRRQPCPVAQSY